MSDQKPLRAGAGALARNSSVVTVSSTSTSSSSTTHPAPATRSSAPVTKTQTGPEDTATGVQRQPRNPPNSHTRGFSSDVVGPEGLLVASRGFAWDGGAQSEKQRKEMREKEAEREVEGRKAAEAFLRRARADVEEDEKKERRKREQGEKG